VPWIFFPTQEATLFNLSKMLCYTCIAQLSQAAKSLVCSQGAAYFEENSGLLFTFVLHWSLYLRKIQIAAVLVGKIPIVEDDSLKVPLLLFDGNRICW